MPAPSHPLPSLHFRTADLPASDRYEIWRDTMSVTHEVAPPHSMEPSLFSADNSAWNCGSMVLCRTTFSTQHITRTARRARQDQVDHYVFSMLRAGSFSARTGKDAVEAKAGELFALDDARPLDSLLSDSDMVTVILPREFLDDALPSFDLHGQVLRDGLGRLLADYFSTLADKMPELSVANAPYVARATRDMIAACLAPARDRLALAQPQVDGTLITQAKRFIDRNLHNADLSPQRICAALGISRSSLYRLFERQGGVAAFIQGRRLDRIHSLLANPREHRRLSEIAQTYGFTSDAHFSTAFRRRFGYSPRDARAGEAEQRDRAISDSTVSGSYHEWLRGLGV